MNASKMMARIMTTIQKKNTMMPGMAYPATVLALATAASYPSTHNLFRGCLPGTTPASGPEEGLAGSFIGRGYGTDAMRVIVGYGFREPIPWQRRGPLRVGEEHACRTSP
jgi:hypothetical protein